MNAAMTTPRMLYIPVIALVVALAFSLAGRALALPSTSTPTISGYVDTPAAWSPKPASAAASNDCWCWIDAKTGKTVPTVPLSGVNILGDGGNKYVGVTQFDPAIDPNHAYNPKTGQNFVRIPCPEEKPSSTTGGVKNAPAHAATDPFQLGVGYSFMRTAQEDVKNLNGFQVSGFYNVNSWLAFGGEFSGLYGTEPQHCLDGDVKTSLDRYLYLFGPQVTVQPYDRTTVYGHVLAGGVHDCNEVTFPGGSMRSSADAFALAVGVGVDFQVTRHFSIGLSFDYVPTHFESSSGNDWQNNWTAGAAAKFSF